MTLMLQELKTAASSLPMEDRAELAQFLIHSLDQDEESDVLTEWIALAEERFAEIETGQVVGIPAEEVLRNLLAPPSETD